MAKILTSCADIGTMVLAAPLFIYSIFGKTNADPAADQIKLNKPPVLLIHGNGSNEIQWVIARQYLKSDRSVFSVNLESNPFVAKETNGIAEYAQVVRDKIDGMLEVMLFDRIVLIGHSMGGLVASYYAEYMSSLHQMQVEKVITISTPWHNPPLLNSLTNITECAPGIFGHPQRYKDMRGEEDFLNNLRVLAFKSHTDGVRNYFCCFSQNDVVVSGDCGLLSLQLEPDHVEKIVIMGHYTSMLSGRVFKKIQQWLLA